MDGKLKSLLAEVFALRDSQIHPGLEKEEVGSWDSLRQMDLVMTLEREYSVTLEIPDIVQMTSVAEIVKVLASKGVDLADS